MDFLPFGEQIAGGQATSYKFTGKERDAELGLGDFDARCYASATGRFMCPDWSAAPVGVPYASFGNPQSLNLYGYVKNNPLSATDPNGHCCEEALQAGEQFWEGPTLAEKIAGGLIVGVAVVGSVLSNPDVRAKVVDVVEAAAANNTATPGPYVGPLLSVDQATKQDVKSDASGNCEYCGQETQDAQKSQKGVTPPGDEGQTDHYKPSSKGGSDDKSNLAHSCRNCNGAKSDSDPTDPNDAAGKKWQLDRMKNQRQVPQPNPQPQPPVTNRPE